MPGINTLPEFTKMTTLTFYDSISEIGGIR